MISSNHSNHSAREKAENSVQAGRLQIVNNCLVLYKDILKMSAKKSLTVKFWKVFLSKHHQLVPDKLKTSEAITKGT